MTKKKTTNKVSPIKAADKASPIKLEDTLVGEGIADRTAADALGDELANEAPGAALIAMLAEFKKLTVKVDTLETENKEMREALVMEKDSGGRYLVRGEHPLPLPIQEEPIDYEAFAVFRSPSGGFKQKLVKAHKTRFDNGDFEITAPVFAEFDSGVCLLHEEELIKLMRAKEVENLTLGKPMFVEVSDKEQKLAARQGKLKSRVIKSQSVTVDTPLAELAV
jgi:hypothetical protein